MFGPEVTQQIKMKEQYIARIDQALAPLSTSSPTYKALETSRETALELIEEYRRYLDYTQAVSSPRSFEDWQRECSRVRAMSGLAQFIREGIEELQASRYQEMQATEKRLRTLEQDARD